MTRWQIGKEFAESGKGKPENAEMEGEGASPEAAEAAPEHPQVEPVREGPEPEEVHDAEIAGEEEVVPGRVSLRGRLALDWSDAGSGNEGN